MLPKSTIIAKNWLLKIELFDNFWRILLRIKTVENKRQICSLQFGSCDQVLQSIILSMEQVCTNVFLVILTLKFIYIPPSFNASCLSTCFDK